MKKKLKKSQSGLEVEYRNQPYYGNYKYKVVIPIPDIHKLRYHESYQDYITYTRYSYWGSYGQSNKELANKDEIERYFAWKDSVPDTVDQKLRLEAGNISVFSNDLSYLKKVVKRIEPDSKNIRYFEAFAPSEPDVMYFSKEPKHKYRVYFKTSLVDKSTRETILRFANDNTDNGVELSETMAKWLKQRHTLRSDGAAYIRAGFHIDYDEPSYEMAIRLMFGELLKPTSYKLLQRPAK